MESKLIEAIQMHPCIYDKSSQAYRNKIMKEKAWDSIADGIGVPVKQCQSRWRSLRDRYVREASVQKSKSGDGAAEKIIWKHFAEMHFLKRHVAPRKTLSNSKWVCSDEEARYPVNNEGSDETLLCENSFEMLPECSYEVSPEFENTPELQTSPIPRENTGSGKKRKIDEAHQKFDMLCGAVTTLIAKKEKESRNESFLKVLDGYLQKHPEDEQDLQ